MPRVDVDGLTLNVAIGGDGPPVVLVHGFTGAGDTWTELRPRLEDAHTVIAPDLIGHGASDAPPEVERYVMRRAVADLVAMLRVLGHERAAWLGYSLGGRTALQLAVHHPDAVAALVLEGASPGIADPAERAARVASDEALAERIEHDGVEAFVDEWERVPLFASQYELPDAARAAIRRTRLGQRAVGLANSLRGMGAGAQEPVHDHLAELRVPTLVLAGSRDTKYVAIAREMAQALPAATMQQVEGAGHAAHIERPQAFGEAVRAFLDDQYRAAAPDGAAQPRAVEG